MAHADDDVSMLAKILYEREFEHFAFRWEDVSETAEGHAYWISTAQELVDTVAYAKRLVKDPRDLKQYEDQRAERLAQQAVSKRRRIEELRELLALADSDAEKD